MGFSQGKTTLILGAGASKEVDLPDGRELKSQIAQLVDIKYEDGYTQVIAGRTWTESSLSGMHKYGILNSFIISTFDKRSESPESIGAMKVECFIVFLSTVIMSAPYDGERHD